MEFTVLQTFIVIVVLVGCGMLFRWIAFDRTDSFAVEVSIISFMVNLVYSLKKATSFQDFKEHYLLRCIILLLIILMTCVVHRLFFEWCYNSICIKIDNVKKYVLSNEKSKGHNHKIDIASEYLDDVKIVTRRSLYICYSRFIDKMCQNTPVLRSFMNMINKNKSNKGFKHNKTALRDSLADLTTYCISTGIGGKEDFAVENAFTEEDFNIGMKAQMAGLFAFQVLPILAIIIGSRII